MASFGVITPVISVVVSVFMLGLSVGTWAGGRWIGSLSDRLRISPIAVYGLIELIIGAGALAVPVLLNFGASLLLPLGNMDSIQYLLFSSGIITIALLPWCICMGATFPLMMEFVMRADDRERTSFSYLYLANVIGAMLGTILTAVALIEVFGFRTSLVIAGCLNAIIAVISFILAKRYPYLLLSSESKKEVSISNDNKPIDPISNKIWIWIILFVTGFISMALEIIWMRAFAPIVGTLVYSFAGLLTVYLLATWIGSYMYRRDAVMNKLRSIQELFAFLAVTIFIPIVISDPRIVHVNIVGILIVLWSIFPFCAALGYMTPMLIDRYSEGRPGRAGVSYAINIIGSILGPLAGGYFFLPFFGSIKSMLLLALPFVVFHIVYLIYRPELLKRTAVVLTTAFIVIISIYSITSSRSYEDGSHINKVELRRDHTATVLAYGQGMKKRLLVNGQGMTILTPITKVMAHMPLAFQEQKPESALVIAFGMGTTYRSLLTWDIKVSAVDLVPSVVNSFGYFHSDAEEIYANTNGKIIIDDGRRFLARTGQLFDVITVDPPPPVETAGTSMLYSEEFYTLMKKRLKPKGIAQLWYPGGSDPLIEQAVIRSIINSFNHVKVFKSLQGWGIHIMASQSPIIIPDTELFISRMPDRAKQDMMEWKMPADSLYDVVAYHVLNKEMHINELLNDNPNIKIVDDRPLNEYFLLRRASNKMSLAPSWYNY